MIGIVDYGVGNVKAFLNVFHTLGVPASRVTTPLEVASVDRLILPGVGSFDHAMKALNSSGVRESLEHQVLEEKTKILGVCVGMQMMTHSSAEGKLPGLGWVDAEVVSLADISNMPLPHMGWNNLIVDSSCGLFAGIAKSPLFYFLHSFYVRPSEVKSSVAQVNYGENFCCAIQKENIFGIQCHPEKSHGAGTRLLQNFSEL